MAQWFKHETPEALAALLADFRYENETGHLLRVRRSGSGGFRIIRGKFGRNGYVTVRWRYREWAVHRVVFAVVNRRWPVGVVDHINGNSVDNAVRNLREASCSQNAANGVFCGHSGCRGVHAVGARWRARIRVRGRSVSLGVFDTPELAAAAYRAAADLHFGEFAYHSRAAVLRAGES